MIRKKIITLCVSLMLLGSAIPVKATSYTEYKVIGGDSLWKISRQFNTSIDNIISLNNLSSTTIYAGQVLKIKPVNELGSYEKYTVVSGDSLWKISRNFNTLISKIMDINNLSSSTIYIGQVLKIPSEKLEETSKVETINYTLQSGDNLWTISQKYNTSMDAIKKSNWLVSDVLMPRQIITIPVNSTEIVNPVGISMYQSRINNSYGDVYTWTNAMRIFTVDTIATVKDLNTGITFKAKYYGGSNHADIVTMTKADTENIKKIFPTWSWNNRRPVVITFSKAGKYYQMAASLTGMPHGSTNIYDNGLDGHLDLYFYNSTSHVSNEMSAYHQKNVLKASGR